MSAMPPPAPPVAWPQDVLDFAAEVKITPYLAPLYEAIGRLFPTATRLEVYLHLDPELYNVRCVAFDVDVPKTDIPDYLAARRRWETECLRICPTTVVSNICFSLIPVEERRAPPGPARPDCVFGRSAVS